MYVEGGGEGRGWVARKSSNLGGPQRPDTGILPSAEGASLGAVEGIAGHMRTPWERGLGEGGTRQSNGLTMGRAAEGRSGTLTGSRFSQWAGVQIFLTQRCWGGVSLKPLALLVC